MTRKNRFLACFDSTCLPYIVHYAKLLSDIDADVFVLMARKAACFVDCLSDLKLTALKGIVTSDRVLDMDTSWLEGKRVVIVDDALVSGTTLYHTTQALRAAKVASITTHVFCVDSTFWSPELAQPDQPYLTLDDQATTAFCASVVEAMATIPRPYNIDWPLFRGIRIPARDFHLLSTMTDWETYDVTSSSQREDSLVSLSSIPGAPVLRELGNSLGWNISAHSQLAKIRLYARPVRGPRPATICQLLPLLALNPIGVAKIEDLWDSLIATSLPDPAFQASFTSPTSRLRLIQYIAAARLGQIWMNSLRPLLSSRIEADQGLANVRFIFPPHLCSEVISICHNVHQPFARAVEVSPKPSAPLPKAIRLRFSCSSLYSVQARLAEPFQDLYRTKELEARQLALRRGIASLSDPTYGHIMDRLRTGLSLPELRHLLQPLEATTDTSLVVSLFLDHAIDRGIVVPVTRSSQDVVYRAYRHGEDVLFSEVEERLCGLMLAELAATLSRTTLQAIWVEKLLVLLIRIGLKKRLFELWTGALGADGTVGVRFSLKGAVVQEKGTNLFHYNPEGALTNLLVESGTLQRDSVSGLYAVGTIPDRVPAKPDAELEAQKIGRLFGSLINDPSLGSGGLLSESDLTFLATCFAPYDIPNALAAEIDIFARHWRWRSHRFMLRAGSREQLDARLAGFRAHPSFEALTSGSWKLEAFLSGKPREIVDRVSNEIRDTLYRKEWQLCWSSLGHQGLSALEAPLARLVSKQGAWLAHANTLMRLLEASLRYAMEMIDGRATLSKDLSRCLREAREYASLSYADEPEPAGLKRAVERAREAIQSRVLRADGLKDYALDGLGRLMIQARGILGETAATATAFGRPRSLTRFTHALFITTLDPDLFTLDYWVKTRGIIHQAQIAARKNEVPVRMDVVPEGRLGGQGRWILAAGQMARRTLIRLAGAIFHSLGDTQRLSLFLFVNIPDGESIVVGDNTSDYQGALFVDRTAAMIERLSARWPAPGITIATPAGGDSRSGARGEAEAELDGIVTRLEEAEDRYTTPLPAQWAVIRMGKTDARKRRRRTAQRRRRTDVGVLTVVTEETKALVELLSQNEGFKQVPRAFGKRLYYEGQLVGPAGFLHSVVATQAVDQGNRSMANAYNALIHEYGPRVIFLVGIAGSISSEASLCDVVLADQIVYYDKRKETPSGPRRRGETYKIPSAMATHVNELFVVLGGEPAILPASSGSRSATFKLQRGPLGTGEAVVGFRDSTIREFLVEFNDKTLCLETEAGGAAQAFYEAELDSEAPAEAYAVIRGISDHADEAKSDLWRMPAARNAANALATLMRLLPSLR